MSRDSSTEPRVAAEIEQFCTRFAAGAAAYRWILEDSGRLRAYVGGRETPMCPLTAQYTVENGPYTNMLNVSAVRRAFGMSSVVCDIVVDAADNVVAERGSRVWQSRATRALRARLLRLCGLEATEVVCPERHESPCGGAQGCWSRASAAVSRTTGGEQPWSQPRSKAAMASGGPQGREGDHHAQASPRAERTTARSPTGGSAYLMGGEWWRHAT